jgi:hypothetical protein
MHDGELGVGSWELGARSGERGAGCKRIGRKRPKALFTIFTIPYPLFRSIVNLTTCIRDIVTVLLGVPEGCPEGAIGFPIVVS